MNLSLNSFFVLFSDEYLAKYPFRVLRPEGQVVYEDVNIEGTVHLAAKVFVHQNNKINLVFTRIGLDRIGKFSLTYFSSKLSKINFVFSLKMSKP